MGLLPQNLNGRITFYETHVPTWESNAVAIGSSVAEIAALETKTAAARAALIAQQEAQATAKTKTAALRDAVRAMMDAGSDVIIKIRAKAATDGDGIYQLANIPAPAIPSPKPAPGQPYGLKVELDGNGTVTLKWKCNNPAGSSGTVYQVWRKIGASGDYVYVGGAGEKKFVDGTIPAGATQLTYQIQAVRSTAVGQWATFTVLFGTNSGGGMTASVTETPEPKIAA